MAANANDVFTKVGYATATTLSSPGYTAGSSTSVNVGSTATWPTSTGVIFAIDEAEVVDGEEVRVDGTYNVFEGTVASGTQITNVDYIGGDTERNYSAGALTRVYMLPASYLWNRLIDGVSAEHDQLDGTHTDITADSISVANNIDVVDTKSIRDGNNNELVTFSQTASAVNELTVANAATGNAPTISATGGDTNVDLRLAPKGTGNIKRGSSGGAIDWWEELGRTTLSSSSDTITISSFSARTHLRIIIKLIATGGTVAVQLRFNNDSSTNYGRRSSLNGGAEATQTSVNQTSAGTSSDTFAYCVVDCINIAGQTKFLFGELVQGNTSAATAPDRLVWFGKWANNTDQITRIDMINGGTGDCASGSEVIVLGHD